MKHLILQTCVPHYRLPLFDLLAVQLGENFSVSAGDRFFDPSLRTAGNGKPWYRPCKNHFLLGNRFLWQSGLPILERGSLLVVEGNPRILSTWVYLARAKAAGVRTAVWGHAFGRGAIRLKPVRKLLFSMADEIICYGFDEKDRLRKHFPNKPISVAGNSVLRRADLAPQAEQTADRTNILCLGRLIAEKKISILLEALALIQKRGMNLGCIIVGDGPQRAFLERLAQSRDLHNIEFTGHQESLEILRGYASRCFCLASPGYAGLSILHALGLGLPFVYSPDEPNAPEIEIAQQGFNCTTFASDNPESLAQSLTRLYEDRRTWLSRRGEFSAHVFKRYTIDGMAETFTRFFQNHEHRGSAEHAPALVRHRADVAGKQPTTSPRYLVLQTCAPDYRVPFFDLLAESLRVDFAVVAGARYFDPSLSTACEGKPWYRFCRNRFLANNSLLWQSGLPVLEPGSRLVVEANPRILSTWIYLARAKAAGIRTAAWGHAFGRGANRLRPIRKLLFLMADEIICYSHSQKAALVEALPKKHITVAGNSVLQKDLCHPLPFAAEGRNQILILGRLVAEKKVELLLRALGFLQKLGLPIGGVIIGEGPERPNLEALAKNEKLIDVTFAGHQNRIEEISKFASRAFCVVCPGTAGLALMHAQGFGLPFVFCPAEQNGPETEIAQQGFNCLTFKKDDANSLADALSQLYRERQTWLGRGCDFAEKTAELYSIEGMADTFLSFFREPFPAAK